jgi:hypothetical protein
MTAAGTSTTCANASAKGYGAALVPPPVQESKPAAQAKPSSVAADVADVLPKNLLPGSKAPAEPFFDTNAD